MKSFYVVEFRTADGNWHESHTITALATGRKLCAWYQAQWYVTEARLMRGGRGGEIVR